MTGMNEAKKKILLVDDDEDFVMMNEAVLTNLGYEVDSATPQGKVWKKSNVST
jgi:CheY-like chemotaxis protein